MNKDKIAGKFDCIELKKEIDKTLRFRGRLNDECYTLMNQLSSALQRRIDQIDKSAIKGG